MANAATITASSLLPTRALTFNSNNKHVTVFHHIHQKNSRISQKSFSLKVKAAKLPAGVELPKVEPKFQAPSLGFTRTAEIWNSRACMIGLIGTFIVELILNKGILQLIGVDIGKGLDLPL